MVAVATLFKDDFSIDYAFETNLKFMTDKGLKTKIQHYSGGAGGEHPVLNVEERIELMKVAVESVDSKVLF